MSDRQPRRWTSAEDQILRDQVDAHHAKGLARDWCQVAMALPGRTNKDCRKRWHNSVVEGIKKGQWSKSEDQLLTEGVHRYGPQWTRVATCVDTRSADQCAKRWQQSLDPCLDHSEWREDEDIALLTAVERLGRHWKDIQRQHLPQRSKNCIKNRYSVLSRRNASQLLPYEDGMEGSSSDPGTPLRLEAELALEYTEASFAQDATQALYEHHQYLHANNNESSTGWVEFSGEHNGFDRCYSGSFNAIPTSTYPAIDSNYALCNYASQWALAQSDLGMQQSTQYLAASPTPLQTYTYCLQPASTTMSYTTSMGRGTNAYRSTAGLPLQPSRMQGYNSQCRSRAPFGGSSR